MFYRSDSLYSEAASSIEKCDQLILRLRRARTISFVIFIVICLLAIIGCIIGLVLINTAIHSTLSIPGALKPLTSVPLPLVFFFGSVLVTGLFSDLATISNIDTRIKVLLILRSQQIASQSHAATPNA